MKEEKKGINLINVIRKLDDNSIKVKLLILIYDETYKQKKQYYMVWSNDQLVDKLGYDRRTIYKALSELEKGNIIEIKRISGKHYKKIKIIE